VDSGGQQQHVEYSLLLALASCEICGYFNLYNRQKRFITSFAIGSFPSLKYHAMFNVYND